MASSSDNVVGLVVISPLCFSLPLTDSVTLSLTNVKLTLQGFRFFSFLISNIFFKIVVNDVLTNLSMMVVTSLKSLEPCKKKIIEYDLEDLQHLEVN